MELDISQLDEIEQTIARRERMQKLREAVIQGTRLYMSGQHLKHLRLMELLGVGDRLRSEGAYRRAYDVYIEALGKTTTPEDSQLVIGPREMVMSRLERLVRSIMQDRELSRRNRSDQIRAYSCARQAIEVLKHYQQ